MCGQPLTSKSLPEGVARPCQPTLAGPERQSPRDAPADGRLRTVMQVTWSLVAGGMEMYALSLAAGLNSSNYRSMLCPLDMGGALEAEARRLRIPYFVMHRRPGIDLRLMGRLYRLFRDNRVDVVHTHQFNELLYSALGARIAGARIIHTEHSMEHLRRKDYRRTLRLLSRFCDRVIAIGPSGAGFLRAEVGIPEAKLGMILAGVDLSAFAVPKSEARLALGIGGSDRIALCVARLSPEKNHRLLLAAFSEVARQVERARLLIAGEGREEGMLREEIRRWGLDGRVDMLGVRRDVARLLGASDVFVLASQREGLPIAVLEAMAAGRPVVATEVGDVPFVVKPGCTGRLVPPGDRDALASALIEMLMNPDRAVDMGMRGRRAAEAFSMRNMVEAYETLYAQSARRTAGRLGMIPDRRS